MFVSNFTATPGDTATLHCPTPPGQLGQYYSVQWKKGYAVVAALISSLIKTSTAPRHSIDRDDFSLIIEDVQLGDASSSYKCEVFVRDPLSFNGETNIRLATVPDVLITLQVSGKLFFFGIIGSHDYSILGLQIYNITYTVRHY